MQIDKGMRVFARWFRMSSLPAALPGAQPKGSGDFVQLTGTVESVGDEGVTIRSDGGDEAVLVKPEWIRHVLTDREAAWKCHYESHKGGAYLVEQELEAAFKAGWDAALDEVIGRSRAVASVGGTQPPADDVVKEIRKA